MRQTWPPEAGSSPSAERTVTAVAGLAGDGAVTLCTPPAGGVLLSVGVHVASAWGGGSAVWSGAETTGALPAVALTASGSTTANLGYVVDGSPLVITVSGTAAVGDAVAWATYSIP